MNQYLIAHVCAELVVIGGVTLFFMKKHKAHDTSVRALEEKLIRYEEKIKTMERSIETLYQTVEGLSEQILASASSKSIPSYSAPPSALRNRKHKVKIVSMPVFDEEEEEDVIEVPEHKPPRMNQVPTGTPGMPSMPSMMPMMASFLPSILPVDAIFGMMSSAGGSPLDELANMTQSSSIDNTNKVMVEVEDDEDTTGIEEELASLNNQASSSSSAV
jgi:hypothetical protein